MSTDLCNDRVIDGLSKALLLIICGFRLWGGRRRSKRSLITIHCVIGAVDALFELDTIDDNYYINLYIITYVIYDFFLVYTPQNLDLPIKNNSIGNNSKECAGYPFCNLFHLTRKMVLQ